MHTTSKNARNIHSSIKNSADTQLVLSLLALRQGANKLPVQPRPNILQMVHSVAGTKKILETMNHIKPRKRRQPARGATKATLEYMASTMPNPKALVFTNNEENTPIGRSGQIRVEPYTFVYVNPRTQKVSRVENPPLTLTHKTFRDLYWWDALENLGYDLNRYQSQGLNLRWNRNNRHDILSIPPADIDKSPTGPFSYVYHYARNPIIGARTGNITLSDKYIFTHTYPFWQWKTGSRVRVTIKIPTRVLERAKFRYNYNNSLNGIYKTSVSEMGSAYRTDGFGTIMLPKFWGKVTRTSNNGKEIELTYLGEPPSRSSSNSTGSPSLASRTSPPQTRQRVEKSRAHSRLKRAQLDPQTRQRVEKSRDNYRLSRRRIN